MSISSTVKALISMTGVKQGDLAPVLGVKSVQAVSNKFRLGQWKAADLVSIADYCGCRLCFVLPDGVVLPISAADPAGAGAGGVQAAWHTPPEGVSATGPISAGVTKSCNDRGQKPSE